SDAQLSIGEALQFILCVRGFQHFGSKHGLADHRHRAQRAGELATTDPSDIPAGAVLAEQWRHVADLGVPTLRSPSLCGLDAS
ncbi:hypothetical protein BST36_30685, partial [Mycolicibacterium moriokaense]